MSCLGTWSILGLSGEAGQVMRQPGPRQGTIVCVHVRMDEEQFNHKRVPPFLQRRLTFGAGSAVLTEQGSSASHMTAAKVMDYISRPPGCPGQAAGAVSAYTQVKMEDEPSLSEVRMSRYLDTSTTTQMAKIMVQYGRSSRSS